MAALQERIVKAHFYNSVDPRCIVSLAFIQLYGLFGKLLFTEEGLTVVFMPAYNLGNNNTDTFYIAFARPKIRTVQNGHHVIL